MDKFKKLIWALFTSGTATLLSFLISFLLTPYISAQLGVEAYGFVTLARSFVTYASIVTLALNSYAARYIVVEYHKGNREAANRYFSSVFWGDVVLGGAIFLVGLILIANLDRLLRVPAGLVQDVRLLFFFVMLNFFITTAASVFGVAAYVKNCIHLAGIFRTVSYLAQILLYLWLFGVFTPHLWYVGLAELVVGSIVTAGGLFLSKTKTPDLLISRKLVSFAAIRQLLLSGIWNALNSLGNVLNSGLDLVITNLLLTNTAMGQLAVTKTLAGAFSSIYQLVSQAFQPMLLKTYSEHDTGKLIGELRLSMKVSGFFSCMIFAGMFTFGRPFFALWMPGQDTELLYWLTVLTALTSVTEGPMFPLYYIYTLTVKLKFPCIVTLCGGVLNVAAMYVLIRYFGLGVYVVVLTTVVVMTFINTVTNPLYMAKCLSVSPFTFYPPLGMNVLSCVAMCVAFRLLAALLQPAGWLSLGFAVLCCTVIGGGIHAIFVLNHDEKRRIAKIVSEKIPGRK